METTKEEMMMLLRELQDLQMWLLKIGSESVFAVVFGGSYFFSVTARVTCDRHLIYRTVDVVAKKPFSENFSNLKDFIDYVYVKEKEYARKKSETN